VVGVAAPALPIRGRATEIAVLTAALDRVQAGRLAVVLLEGEAGIGKTRLLDLALQDASDRGLQVAAGRAGELERTRPFGLVASVFRCARASPDPQRAAIAQLLSAAGGDGRDPITVTSDPGLRFRVVDAFADLAEEVALAGPLLIGVDDLQWADPSSLLALAAMGRRLADLPMALIGCLRPLPGNPELDRLTDVLGAAGAQRLVVQRLGDEAVSELVADAVAAVPGPRLLAEVSGAAGNPLFVTELLGALTQEGAITAAEGWADVAAVTLPPTLRLTILRRIGFLPEASLQTLRAACILGSAFTVTDLALVTGRSALELSVTLREAVRAHVIEDDGTRLRFRHDLIRDAIYEDLPGSVRSALHREAGQRLAESGAAASQVAEHLARAASPGDPEAVTWLTRAAREAAPTSPDVAADLLERAIELMAPADANRDRLLAEQASSVVLAGRSSAAMTICRALLERDHDPSAEGAARLCLAHALLVSGHPRDGLGQLDSAADLPVLTEAERASTLGLASVAHRWLGNLDASASVAARARTAGETTGDHLTTAIAMTSLATVQELHGQLGNAVRMIDEAISVADRSPGRQGHLYPVHAHRAFILIELDRLDEARLTLDIGRRISEELGRGWHLPSYQMVRATERFTAGEWDDAIAEVEANIELADETGQAFGLILDLSVLALVSLHRNDLGQARAASSAAMSRLGNSAVQYRTQWAVWAHALVLEADGHSAHALAKLTECWQQCAEVGLTVEYRMLGPDLVRLALAGGDRALAQDAAAAVATLRDANCDVASVAGAALRCQGLANDDVDALHAAASAYASAPRPFEQAQACEDAGAALARRGDIDRARPLLERAVEIYERLDAARDVGRIEAVLREAGIRRGRRGARRRPQSGWASLTPTERTIAGLVTEGLSNPQIGDRLYISRRTVQTHLAHVFTKLDIASRSQLAANLAARGDQITRLPRS
jgi:DNA-binding CsgD family transcriptional regulator